MGFFPHPPKHHVDGCLCRTPWAFVVFPGLSLGIQRKPSCPTQWGTTTASDGLPKFATICQADVESAKQPASLSPKAQPNFRGGGGQPPLLPLTQRPPKQGSSFLHSEGDRFPPPTLQLPSPRRHQPAEGEWPAGSCTRAAWLPTARPALQGAEGEAPHRFLVARGGIH